jgi:hypothetical protein
LDIVLVVVLVLVLGFPGFFEDEDDGRWNTSQG